MKFKFCVTMHNSRDDKIKSVNGPSGENRVRLRALALLCFVFHVQRMGRAERRELPSSFALCLLVKI